MRYLFATQNTSEYWKKREKKKDNCIIWMYLNTFHSCFLLNTVKWQVRVTIHILYTAYSVLNVYWCCIPGLETNEISLDQVTLHQNKQHQNSRVRSLSRPQPPRKRPSARHYSRAARQHPFHAGDQSGPREIYVLDIMMRAHTFSVKLHIRTTPAHTCPRGMQRRKKNQIINTRNIEGLSDVCVSKQNIE